MFESSENAVAAFESITDAWYLNRLKEVEKSPVEFVGWNVENGLLYRHRRNPLLDLVVNREENWKLVVPAAEYRKEVLQNAHCLHSAGHLRIEKTFDRVGQEYYWHGVYHDVVAYVRACELCQRFKVSQSGAQGLMSSRIVEQPWTVVAADLMEFPPSKARNKYLIVFQDLFTRWVEVKAVRKANGKTVVRAFEELVLFRWETPRYLLTDNGREFANKWLNGVLDEYGVKHITTPPYHPQANPVERTNRTLKTMIAAFVGSDQRNWDVHVHEFRHAVNTAVQSTTRVSPAFLNFGREPQPVKSLRRRVEGSELVERIPQAEWTERLKRLAALRELVKRHIDKEREKQTVRYNRGKRATFFSRDLVLRRTHKLSSAVNQFNAKLAAKYDGPYKIVEVLSPSVYVLEQGSSDARKVLKVHVSDLKRYVPPGVRHNEN